MLLLKFSSVKDYFKKLRIWFNVKSVLPSFLVRTKFSFFTVAKKDQQLILHIILVKKTFLKKTMKFFLRH